MFGRYFGLDAHAETIYVRVLSPLEDPDQDHYEFDLEHLDQFIAQLRPDDHLALEATTNSYYLYHRLKEAVPQGSVSVANPVKLALISQSDAKTDRNDSEVLALLLLLGKLPTIWVPDERNQQDRVLVHHRHQLAGERTRILNRLRSTLIAHGLRCSSSSLRSKDARRFLASVQDRMSGTDWMVMESHLRRLSQLDEEIQALDAEVELRAAERPERALLATIPGVGPLIALTMLAIIGNIERFQTPGSLARYAGLVPRVRSSAGRAKHGKITKAGSKALRWAAVEATQQLRQCSPTFRRMFRRLERRAGKPKATVACARKLLEVVWCMLTRNEPFREIEPCRLARKERMHQQRLEKASLRVSLDNQQRWTARGRRPCE